MRQTEGWLWGVTGLALALRLPRAVSRWDEIALAYAAYWEPTARHIREWSLGEVLTTWTGLHPPLYGIFLGSMESVLPVPMFFLLASVAFSTLAVYAVGRIGGPLAALVLATSPIQLSYAAELNNYPMAVGLIALCVLLHREDWRWVGAAAVAAAWCHVLAAFGALGLVAARVYRERANSASLGLLVLTGLGMLPIGVGALRLLGQDGSFGQDGDASGWLELALQAVGIEGLLISGLALWAWRHPAAWIWAGMASVLGMTLILGIASAEQLQYLPLLGPPVAVLIGVAVTELRSARLHAWMVGLVILACGSRAVRFMVDESHRLSAIAADQQTPRGVDLAVSSSRPGDTLWLVAPANEADDDKTATAPALWRISPTSSMPLAYPVDFEYVDYRYGQPREWEGRIVHTSTELYAAPFDHAVSATLAAGGEIWVVLYEHGHADGLVDRVERVLRPYEVEYTEVPRGDHPERVYRVRGLLTEGANG
jgi:hypothetical protein